MKNILTALFLICALASNSQDWKEQKKLMKEHQARADTSHFPSPFEFVFIDSINLSKSELFSKVNTWLPTVFTNTNLAITKDSMSGKFVLARIESSHSSDYTYNLVIDVRDNKYRFAFTNFIYKDSNPYASPYSMDETDKIKAIVIGQSKKAYWNNEKLYLKDQAENAFFSFKKYVVTKDDF